MYLVKLQHTSCIFKQSGNQCRSGSGDFLIYKKEINLGCTGQCSTDVDAHETAQPFIELFMVQEDLSSEEEILSLNN